MGGEGEGEAGITPRLCRALFERIEEKQSADLCVELAVVMLRH